MKVRMRTDNSALLTYFNPIGHSTYNAICDYQHLSRVFDISIYIVICIILSYVRDVLIEVFSLFLKKIIQVSCPKHKIHCNHATPVQISHAPYDD